MKYDRYCILTSKDSHLIGHLPGRYFSMCRMVYVPMHTPRKKTKNKK